MGKKNNVKSTLQIHSQAKVEFYERYLIRYLRILCSSEFINQINIYDVFCGMGIYDDGGKGSPIVAFDAIKKLRNENINYTKTKITLIVNDNSEEKIERVKNYIEDNNQNDCNFIYYNNDVNDMFVIVKKDVSKTETDTRNLIFIDPYGYKDIKKETIHSLMVNKKTELILFLPISHMHRFTQIAVQDDEKKAQYAPLRSFINSFFHENHRIMSEKLNIMEYIQCISEALRFKNQFFSTSYYIERDAANHFALFFMSSHIFGFEKILEVKWALDEDSGRGFKIPEPQKGLFDELFAVEKKIENSEKLESILFDFITKKEPNNKQIYIKTLESEFLPKHTNEILAKLQQQNPKFKVYDIKTKSEARKKSFYISYKNYKEEDRVIFRLI